MEPKRSMSTLPDEPEWSFLLEEKSGYVVFSSWTVRNLTLKGRLLCLDDGSGSLTTLADLDGSNTIKLPPSSSKSRQFRFQLTCKNGSKRIFNAAHEEAREKCIIMFNFAAKTSKWFYPFDELSYIDHPTMEIFGLPIKRPIYVPKPAAGGVGSSSASSSGPIIYTTGADKKKALSAAKQSGSLSRPESPVNIGSPIKQHKHHVPFSASAAVPTGEIDASNDVSEQDSNSQELRDSVVENANSPFPPSRAAPKMRSPKGSGHSPEKIPSPIIDATPIEEVQ